MTLRTLEPSARRGDQVYDALHTAIMRGELPAGRTLRIRDLAEELGTSVMPVREALRRLEEIGLIEAAPYRGAIVKTFTAEELLHVYQVRQLLEVEASTLGTARFPESDLPRLRTQCTEMERALEDSRVADYLDHDEEFLSIVYAAAQNPVLLETIRNLWRRCRTYKIVGARQEIETGSHEQLLVYQRAMLEAACAQDGSRAGAVAERSLTVAMERIRDALPES